MYHEFMTALEEGGKNDACVVAMVTGTGDYYCSGNDLSNFTRIPPEGPHNSFHQGGYQGSNLRSLKILKLKTVLFEMLANFTSHVIALYLAGLFIQIFCTPFSTVTSSSLYLLPVLVVFSSELDTTFDSSSVLPNLSNQKKNKIMFTVGSVSCYYQLICRLTLG